MPKVVRIAIAATFGVNLAWLEEGHAPKHVKPEQYSVTDQDLDLLRFLKQQSSLYELIRSHLNPATRRSAHSAPIRAARR